MKTTNIRVRRYNGKCRACKAHHTDLRFVAVEVITGERGQLVSHREWFVTSKEQPTSTTHAPVLCCGREVYLQPVKGTRKPEIKCGAKCWSSKGHVCDCSCGGRNHGCGKPPVEIAI